MALEYANELEQNDVLSDEKVSSVLLCTGDCLYMELNVYSLSNCKKTLELSGIIRGRQLSGDKNNFK